MTSRNFYVVLATRAFREAMTSVGFRSHGEVMRGLVSWAIAVLFLYAINWRGWPIVGTSDANGGEQIRLGLCAVAGILVVFVGSLVWQLILQPNKIYKETLAQVDEADHVISGIGDSEADRRFLSLAHQEGFRLYRAPLDPSDPVSIALWKAPMDEWVARVALHLKERWSISASHEFEDGSSMGGFQYRRESGDSIMGSGTPPRLQDEHGFSIFCKYSAYLKSLDAVIRYGETAHLGDVQELLKRRSPVRIENEGVQLP